MEPEETDTLQVHAALQLHGATCFQVSNQLLSLSEQRSASPESFTVPPAPHSDRNNKTTWAAGPLAASQVP